MNDEDTVKTDATDRGDLGRVPRLTTTWMRYVVGFSVSVGVGLAPYLGKVNIPLFTPMLSLIPESLQDVALSISSASMGVVAVLVQWYASAKANRQQLHRLFVQVAVACVVSLLVLCVVEVICIVRVPVPAVNGTVAFAVGPLDPHKALCDGLTKVKCITGKLRTLEESSIESYFGETQANVTKLVFVVAYTAFMSAFALLVGLAIIAKAIPK